MTDQDEANVYTDLHGFLQSDRTDVRIAAIDAVLAVKDKYVFASRLLPIFSYHRTTIYRILTTFSHDSLSLSLSRVSLVSQKWHVQTYPAWYSSTLNQVLFLS
jgi:hypothetical protein